MVAKETEINTIEMLLRSISNAVAAAVGTTAAPNNTGNLMS